MVWGWGYHFSALGCHCPNFSVHTNNLGFCKCRFWFGGSGVSWDLPFWGDADAPGSGATLRIIRLPDYHWRGGWAFSSCSRKDFCYFSIYNQVFKIHYKSHPLQTLYCQCTGRCSTVWNIYMVVFSFSYNYPEPVRVNSSLLICSKSLKIYTESVIFQLLLFTFE